MPEPYVGITGFKTRAQVDAVLPIVSGPRKLMVGVLASQGTIMQREPDERSPRRDNIAGAFPPGDNTINLIHYYTKDQTDLDDQLTAAYYFGGPHCHGLQLNIAWPDPNVLRSWRLNHPEIILVIQLGGRRWKLTDYTPRELSKKVLNDYDGIADYVLLDPSGGLNIPMDVEMIRSYAESLDAYLATARRPMGIAIAGGLDADRLETIRQLCGDIPSLSFDAEGGLHSGPGQLDLEHCKRYLENAKSLPV